MRAYLEVEVTRWNGRTFYNDLKLSESHLINILAKENDSLKVKRVNISKEFYNAKF